MGAAVSDMDDYRVRDKVYRLIQREPDIADRLAEMVNVEIAPHNSYWLGWRCQDVHTAPAGVNRLIYAGIVNEVYHARSGSAYRLASVSAVQGALADAQDTPAESRESVDVDSLFHLVIGLDAIKAVLRDAIGADGPVHMLLISQPGMAKTLILSEIGALPGGVFYVGSTTSKAGLVDMLLLTKPAYLVIDEIDKMADADMSPLLNLMETGFVSRLKHGQNDRVQLATKVFAGCNDTSKIKPEILSRFGKLVIPPYSRKEYLTIAIRVLVEREGQDIATAKAIAVALAPYSTDLRDAVRVARMARKDPARVQGIIDVLFRQNTRPQ